MHPYTEGLMLSIPRLSDKKGRKLEVIPGAVPHPLDLPVGCKFAPRCKYATEKCQHEEPDYLEVEPGHFVRCFYPENEVRRSGKHSK
jgi:peptide/nickel transport system ATP-binding protein